MPAQIIEMQAHDTVGDTVFRFHGDDIYGQLRVVEAFGDFRNEALYIRNIGVASSRAILQSDTRVTFIHAEERWWLQLGIAIKTSNTQLYR